MSASRPPCLGVVWVAVALSVSSTAIARDDTEGQAVPSGSEAEAPESSETTGGGTHESDQVPRLDLPDPLQLQTGLGVIAPARDVYDEGAFVYVFAGLSQLDLDAINELLEAYGYGRISKTFSQIGTGAFVTVKHWLFGLEYYNLNSNSGEPAPNTASFDGLITAAHVAYLFSVGPLHIYPVVGFGYGRFELGLVENSPNLDEVLSGNIADRTIEIGAYLVQAMVSAEYMFVLSETEETVRGVLLGLRLGFLFSPLGTRWTVQGVDINEPNDDGISSAHLSLVLGFGSWSASELPMF